jgi:hypothetical protein
MNLTQEELNIIEDAAVSSFMRGLVETFGPGTSWSIPKDQKRRDMVLKDWREWAGASIAPPSPPKSRKLVKGIGKL